MASSPPPYNEKLELPKYESEYLPLIAENTSIDVANETQNDAIAAPRAIFKILFTCVMYFCLLTFAYDAVFYKERVEISFPPVQVPMSGHVNDLLDLQYQFQDRGREHKELMASRLFELNSTLTGMIKELDVIVDGVVVMECLLNAAAKSVCVEEMQEVVEKTRQAGANDESGKMMRDVVRITAEMDGEMIAYGVFLDGVTAEIAQLIERIEIGPAGTVKVEASTSPPILEPQIFAKNAPLAGMYTGAKGSFWTTEYVSRHKIPEIKEIIKLGTGYLTSLPT